MRIALFDSGIGGLTILSELYKNINAEFIYYADTINLPYGEKTNEEIKILSFEAIKFLLSKKPDLIIIACHTVSAITLKDLRKEFNEIPIIGMIEPSILNAVQNTKNLKIGLLGTVATINSNAHCNQILKINRQVNFYANSCPLLVPMIENNYSLDGIEKYVKKYLNQLTSKNIDTLILGCTHYGIIDKLFVKILPKEIKIISSKEIVKEILNQIKFSNNIQKNIEYYSSGNYKKFKENIDRITLCSLLKISKNL